MAQFVPKNKGPVTIKAANSNTISDAYRDSLTIAYQFIGSRMATTAFTFGGKTYDTPIMMGPTGGLQNAPNGTVGAARAVREAGSIFWTGFHEPDAWHQVLTEGIPAIRVIKPLRDNDRVLEEIRHDTENGAVGYAMDFDHGFTVYGELDAQKEPFAPKTVEELKMFNEASELPFFLKSVMSVRDALLAKEIGVAGIVISGHNNRFPCEVPALKLLPEIRKAVGDEMTIFIDGGLNNGYDAFKALALGANGVLVARAASAAYVNGQEEGLTEKFLEMTAELKGAMSNTGSPDLQHINHDCIIAL